MLHAILFGLSFGALEFFCVHRLLLYHILEFFLFILSYCAALFEPVQLVVNFLFYLFTYLLYI